MPRSVQARIGRLGIGLVLLVPAALFLGLGIDSGGFFPDAVSIGVVGVIIIFVLRAASSRMSFAGMGWGLGVVTIALIAFATWTLVSGSWSGSSSRAVLAYNLVLLYAGVFVLIGVLGRSGARATVLVYSLTAVSVGISVVAAATWLAPDLATIDSDIPRIRLSWPTSYWNTAGLIAALAVVWSFSLSCSSTVPPRVRVLAAMATPIPAATLIFSVSRGAAAVAILGIALAIIMIRSSATPGGVASAAPALVLSSAIALHVKGLNVANPAAHAVDAGHRAGILLVAVACLAAALRIALLWLDTRLAGARPRWTPRQSRVAVGAAIGVLAVAFVALGGPGRVRAAVHKFVAPETSVVPGNLPASQRLTQLGSNGRIDEWHVAWVDGFLRHPLDGTGAGTYATLSTRYASTAERVLNAHSLYIEELGELGIIGGGLVIMIVASILFALARRARGAERQIWAPLFVGSVMWAVHAGVDWDWQMPAITAWVFAAGGLALALPVDRASLETQPAARFAIVLGCLLLTITPVEIWRSQTQIIKAVNEFEQGHCLLAEDAALASNAALSSRPEPFELISYCEAGVQRYPLALSAINAAEIRDPQNWELRYSQSLIMALAGLDPRAAASAALARYPTSPLTRAAVRAFATGNPRTWRRFALAAPLPLPR